MSIDYSQFAISKPRKHKKKRATVTEYTYKAVLERDKYCRLIDDTCKGKLELHHIIYRSEDKSKINDVNNCIMLCVKHHKEVHNNKHYWQSKLKELLKKEDVERIKYTKVYSLLMSSYCTKGEKYGKKKNV